jgi:hypothetical protein
LGGFITDGCRHRRGVTVRLEVGSDEVVQRGSGGRAGPERVEQRSPTASGRGAEVDAVVMQWA